MRMLKITRAEQTKRITKALGFRRLIVDDMKEY